MKEFKNYSNIVLLFLFSFFLLLNFFQIYISQQHWSSRIDQDITVIYNSLLISSGLEQEHTHHPSYTTYFILGSVYKIFSIFFNNFTIEEVLNSKNIDENLQILFLIARVINSIYFCLLALILFKVLKELNINKNICIFGTFCLVFFSSTYELLFLIRPEILSVLLILLFFYYLIKFIKKNKTIYCIFSGFCFCLAMLAKLQVIFLFFTFLISLPLLFNYFKTLSKKNYSNKRKKNNNLYLYFLYISLFGYIFIKLFSAIYLQQDDVYTSGLFVGSSHSRLYIFNNIDFYLFCAFIIFYFLYIRYLSLKNKIDSNKIFKIISKVLIGFILCLILIFFLDLINLIKFNKLNFLGLLNPIEYMSTQTHLGKMGDSLIKESTNIFIAIKEIILGAAGFSKYQFNTEGGLKPLFVELRVYFRTINIIIFAYLIYFLAKKIKNNNLNLLSIVFFLGILIYHLSFNLRETFGYNIYLFPLYIILISIVLNNFKKNFVLFFYVLLSANFLAEIAMTSSLHKNYLFREPRIYDICKIDKWKNSENYKENYMKNNYLALVEDPKIHFQEYTSRFDDKFFLEYCNQMKNRQNN